MFILSLLFIPIIGIFLISGTISYDNKNVYSKIIAIRTSVSNLILSLVIYILFDFSSNQFQFVQEHYDLSYFDIYLGIDGISIFFVILTTFVTPIAILSNYYNITSNLKVILISLLLLESLQICAFVSLDLLLFYIFFESAK